MDRSIPDDFRRRVGVRGDEGILKTMSGSSRLGPDQILGCKYANHVFAGCSAQSRYQALSEFWHARIVPNSD